MLSSGFCCSFETQSENKRKQKDRKYLHLARKLEKTVEHEGNGDTNCIWCTWNSLGKKDLKERLEESEIRGRIETIQTTALSRSTRRIQQT